MNELILPKSRISEGAGGGAGGLAEAGPLTTGVDGFLFSYFMGKGVREPCSPYREAYVFGAPLNEPNADDWNCAAAIVDETSSFDLSTITPNHEVVVALLHIYELYFSVEIKFRWYRDRDSKLLFEYIYTIPDPPEYGYWLWAYVYSYIGYVSWEIWENGDYHVDIYYQGEIIQSMGFTISGIEAPTEEYRSLWAYYNKM
jgi:hypothetical protein